MNINSRKVISEFASPSNITAIFRRLQGGIPVVLGDISEEVSKYKTYIERDLYMSDPILPIKDQVNYYNEEFLAYMNNKIATYLSNTKAGLCGRNPTTLPTRFTLTDNLPTSTRGARHHASSTGHILNTWLDNAAPVPQFRDDHQFKKTRSRTNNGNYVSGVEVCDQSEMNTNYHHEAFFTPYIKALNDVGYTNSSFGNATPMSDARLMERRIFRTNSGVENGIPAHQIRIHHRHYENDIDEDLRSEQYEYKNYGYDMTTLYDRIDRKDTYNYALGCRKSSK